MGLLEVKASQQRMKLLGELRVQKERAGEMAK